MDAVLAVLALPAPPARPGTQCACKPTLRCAAGTPVAPALRRRCTPQDNSRMHSLTHTQRQNDAEQFDRYLTNLCKAARQPHRHRPAAARCLSVRRRTGSASADDHSHLPLPCSHWRPSPAVSPLPPGAGSGALVSVSPHCAHSLVASVSGREGDTRLGDGSHCKLNLGAKSR